MKLTKIAAFVLAALSMTACSDDNEYNTAADVTVDMELTEYAVRESGSLFRLPIKVNGTANGTIIVNLATTPVGEDGAIDEENYTVTSTRIIIAEGNTTGYVEIQPIDNPEENDSRFFNVTIVNVEGAEIGANPTTVVEILDNDQDPYEKICGEWTMTAYSVFQGGDDLVNVKASIVTPDPSDPDEAPYYGSELYLHFGYSGLDCFMTLSYEYDEDTNEISLAVVPGNFACWSLLNFGTYKGVFVGCTTYDRTGASVGSDEPLTLTMDGNKVVGLEFANPQAMYLLGVFEYPAMSFKGYYEGWAAMSVTR